MIDGELEALRDEMEEQGEELREAFADDLGGDPDEYRTRPVADGGEWIHLRNGAIGQSGAVCQ